MLDMNTKRTIASLRNTLKHILEMNVESPQDNFDEGDGHYELLQGIQGVGRYTGSDTKFFIDTDSGIRLDITITAREEKS